jgi:hypothetical protein
VLSLPLSLWSCDARPSRTLLFRLNVTLTSVFNSTVILSCDLCVFSIKVNARTRYLCIKKERKHTYLEASWSEIPRLRSLHRSCTWAASLEHRASRSTWRLEPFSAGNMRGIHRTVSPVRMFGREDFRALVDSCLCSRTRIYSARHHAGPWAHAAPPNPTNPQITIFKGCPWSTEPKLPRRHVRCVPVPGLVRICSGAAGNPEPSFPTVLTVTLLSPESKPSRKSCSFRPIPTGLHVHQIAGCYISIFKVVSPFSKEIKILKREGKWGFFLFLTLFKNYFEM